MSVCFVESPGDSGKGAFRLMRLCEWAGFSRKQFNLVHSLAAVPVGTTVLVPLGPGGLELVGLQGRIDHVRGYVTGAAGFHVIPTFHPYFISRGNNRLSAAFINDLQKAVFLSQHGVPVEFRDYLLDPTPQAAYEWALAYQAAGCPRLAFDIETPGKGDEEDEADTDSDAPDRTWNIERIGFSYSGLSALSIPWEPSHMATIRLLMESPGEKVVWNQGFDVPRIRRSGVGINGVIHDGMVAWHILHTDLPKSLRFVATFTCPWQSAWKHLSGSSPAFYNATDADVEWRAMEAIEQELRRAGLWEVYQRDVLDLQPVLDHMMHQGMPVDVAVRERSARELAEKQAEVKSEIESLMPMETRKVEHVYKNTPKDTTGLECRRGVRQVPVCSVCGVERPLKPHFKRYVKKQNPCQDGQVRFVEREVDEYYRIAQFSPSRDQLVRYHEWLRRPLPTVWDAKKRARKVSFAEKQMKELMLRYPLDKVYPLVLTYREIDKLAGTYIGRPVD